jgi:glutamate-5-semialdehyde dehydrogenase
MTKVASELLGKAQAAKAASRQVRRLSTTVKNAALLAIADALERVQAPLLEANGLDMAAGRKAGLEDAFQARLELTPLGLAAMAGGVRSVAALPDPVGEEFDARTLPNGMHLARRRVPLGVIGTIFEARPEVPVDISSLCLKSGNTVILRGGKEAINTNKALGRLIRDTLGQHGVPENAVQMIESTDRALVQQMVKLDEYIDLLIPRGGAELVHFVAAEATMPAITGGIGVCHTYIDASADVAMACDIVFNAKVQAPAKCNALDAVLVHPAIAPEFLPAMAKRLTQAGVELHADQRALALIGPARDVAVQAATEEDWGQEFLAPVLAVKLVDSMEEAIEHIERYGSGHSEAIVTSNYTAAMQFVDVVDAAVVLVNASTRFNDGGQFGLGTEVAISTNKLHARGPMGLRELTTYKWVALGNGHVRQ